MAITKINIFNIVLKNLGVTKVILDNSAPDKNREVLETFYEIALKQALTEYDWLFASAYRTLTPVENKPINKNYEYAYDYPNDVLFPRAIIINGIYDKEYSNFQVANFNGNQQIWCNVENAVLRYTEDVQKTYKFSNEFVIALSWLLAYFSAPSIVGSRTQKIDCYQEYLDWCNRAKTLDANKDNDPEDEYIDYIEARN